ncbi:MAG: hypothetical protein EAZ31_07080 [Cytophagia bacterium]|nr:MAG: hypothetical protein EAZ31_07080 [Cytophagia bacterium]
MIIFEFHYSQVLIDALVCVPQANVVTNKSIPTTTACGTQAGARIFTTQCYTIIENVRLESIL